MEYAQMTGQSGAAALLRADPRHGVAAAAVHL